MANNNLNPGCRVARRDIPEIVGEVVSMRNGWAKVRWTPHFAQWVYSARLTKRNQTESEAQ